MQNIVLIHIDISSGGMLIETDENIKSKDIRVLFKIEGQSYSSKAKILKKELVIKMIHIFIILNL